MLNRNVVLAKKKSIYVYICIFLNREHHVTFDSGLELSSFGSHIFSDFKGSILGTPKHMKNAVAKSDPDCRWNIS